MGGSLYGDYLGLQDHEAVLDLSQNLFKGYNFEY